MTCFSLFHLTDTTQPAHLLVTSLTPLACSSLVSFKFRPVAQNSSICALGLLTLSANGQWLAVAQNLLNFEDCHLPGRLDNPACHNEHYSPG